MKAKEYIFDASYQPQVRAKRNTTNIMLDVIIALMPALIVGIWQFGVRVILYTVLSVASAVFFEWLYRKLMHKSNSIGDLSAALTGLLTVMILPSSSPWWILLIANLFAIVLVKQLYGGLGKNFLNPALAGRAFVFFSYTLALSNWGVPAGLTASVDAVTMSTPLSLMKAGQALPDYLTYKNMLIGIMPGCIGEVSTIALLVGGIYLLCRKVITWHVPVSFIGSVALLTLIFGHEGYTHVDWMLCNLLTGGLFLGAIFMATDYATCPVTTKGRLIYGIGCGALTVLIRYFGGFPEGVTFAILIMNACAWALDKTPRRQFGETKEDIATAKAAEKAAKKSLKEGA